MTLEIIIAVLLALGIVLTALPTVPGIIYMFLVVLAYGFIDGFQTMSPWQLLIFAGIVILAIATDYLGGVIGAKVGGASKTSMALGLFGLFIGLILLPPLGLFIGLFLGIFIGEMIETNDSQKALKAAAYAFSAAVAGIGFNILLAIGFFITYLFIVF